MRQPIVHVLGLIFLSTCATAALAQAPQALITAPIGESRLITLTGNTPAPALDAANDRGAVDDALALDHMILLLKRTPDTEARLQQLIDALHDPASPQYHKWLTAKQFGERFGTASQDTATISNWLRSHGLRVNRVYQNGLMVDFSGTAGQMRDAFHTEIHNLVLPDGEQHIANISDPQIPAALIPAVA